MSIHCSPFGVIPKRKKPGNFRLILNLSAPEGHSVNDGIDKLGPMQLLTKGQVYIDTTLPLKELVPIVIAATVWGKQWHGQTVQVWCDNAAVVHIINHGSARDKDAMHLARCLACITAKFDLQLVASHIKGAENSLADALPRDNLPPFRSLLPQAAPEPTAIPEALLDLLLVSKPDWTSGHWTELWNSIF